MFFLTYLGRELRRRMRQAIFIALGLALGVGLVVTVAAASAGVRKAQSDVLTTLYGVGTDVTVTGPAPGPPSSGSEPKNGGNVQIGIGPGGAQICTNGKCENASGQTIDNLVSQYSTMSASKVAQVAKLHDVSAAAGGLTLTDTSITFPANFGTKGGSAPPQPNSFTVDGVDTRHATLGPLSAGTLTSGHSFTTADSSANVAVVDSGYAKSRSLKVGSTVTILHVAFKVIGIVSQPSGSSATDVYIPLQQAQAIATAGPGSSAHLTNEVNTVYVAAASAADISEVHHEISRLLPGDTVTTASSLASQITGSVSSAAKLASDLGTWLSILALIAAFAVASLLTMAAVTRRVREFGTLKALGWRSRRIIAQVLGESVAMGIIGAAAGVGLGFAGAAIIKKFAPKLSATVPGQGGGLFQSSSGGGAGPVGRVIGGSGSHSVSVPLSPAVTVSVIVLAVILAVLGGLLAGSFGSWRIARLRPADALARVA